MLGGHVDQRRLGREHPLDVFQADAELAKGADEPRPGHGLGTELPVARGRPPCHRQDARVGIEAQRPHRQSGHRRKLANGHVHDHRVSIRWRVKGSALSHMAAGPSSRFNC